MPGLLYNLKDSDSHTLSCFDCFGTLQVYDNSNQYAVDPAQFLRRIAQHPMGAEFCDGGQHDAQELFRLLLDSLHDDLVRPPPSPPPPGLQKLTACAVHEGHCEHSGFSVCQTETFMILQSDSESCTRAFA